MSVDVSVHAYHNTGVFPRSKRGWAGVHERRACRAAGGHWWHPADAMILWRCCACGAPKEGMPDDGTRSDQWWFDLDD